MYQHFLHVKVPALESLYTEDGRLPDVGRDYIPRPRRHRWSRKEKQILYLLNRYYENDSNDLWKVFSAFFAKQYKRLPKPRRSSWESMKAYNANASRYYVWWNRPTTRRIQAELERKASSIIIDLRIRAPSYVDGSTSTPRKKRYTSSSIVSSKNDDVDWNSDELETDDEDISRTRAHVKRADAGIGLLTPPSTGKRKRQISTHIPVPPIAFRAFNPQSQGLNGIDGFVAGSFVEIDPANIPGPPGEDIYLQDLERHLGRNHRGATPFISVSQNLLRVIVHAIRRSRQARREGNTDWNVAVINFSRISYSARAVWVLDVGIHSRRAFGEWVVYGAIPSTSVLCVLSLDELLRLMSRVPAPFHIEAIKAAKNTRKAREAMSSAVNRRLTYDDGVMFGGLLLSLGIPGRYVEYIGTTILADWRFPEYKNWMSNDAFVQGLNKTYSRTPKDFSSVAIIKEEHDSSDAIPQYDADFTVQGHCDGHEWLLHFMAEVEKAAFGAKHLDHAGSDQHRGMIIGSKDQSPLYFKHVLID